jgi:hypothetical protein
MATNPKPRPEYSEFLKKWQANLDEIDRTERLRAFEFYTATSAGIPVFLNYQGMVLNAEELANLENRLSDFAKVIRKIKRKYDGPKWDDWAANINRAEKERRETDRKIKDWETRQQPKAQPDCLRWVYVAINHRNGYHKIGYSKNPALREKTLQSEEPEIELLFSYRGDGKHEKELHEMFSHKRLRGEWFTLDDCDLTTIKNYLQNAV